MVNSYVRPSRDSAISNKVFSDRGRPSFNKYTDMEFAFQILHIGPKIRLVFAIAADITAEKHVY